MTNRTFLFAGGGTGGHIYPALAVAEKIQKNDPTAVIHFFCSSRDIDAQILNKTDFEYTILPARSFTLQPDEFIRFCRLFFKSCRLATSVLKQSYNPIVFGVGGFVAAPVCRAGYKLKVPVKLLNVDIVPGRANKLAVRWADEVFVQFRETAEYFAGRGIRANVVGCPLRSGFDNPQPEKVREKLGLKKNKKVLLVTGASSGSASINETMPLLLDKLARFADNWQLIHLTGTRDFEDVKAGYAEAKINAVVLSYFDDMADLLSLADLAIGRSGAVSVAEFAAAGTPGICIPYPHHKDRHQYLNAEKLVQAGAAVVTDDLPDAKERADWLWEELRLLLSDKEKREQMRRGAESIAVKDAAERVARRLLEIE